MANKPVILLVPGAFGTPDGFEKLAPFLTKAGLATHPAPYPSCDSKDPTNATCQKDIETLRDQVFVPVIDQQKKDVVILAHSYGGVVGGAAAKGFDKKTRQAQGLAGGVVGLIYVAGNITLEGESLLDAVGGAYPPFIKLDKPSKDLALIEPAMDVLYNDVDKSLEPVLAKYMRPHANHAFETKATAPAWSDVGFDGKRVYVRTMKDACNPSFLQDMWIDKTKVEWEIVDFQTGHMPFVSAPEALAKQIAKSVDGFVA